MAREKKPQHPVSLGSACRGDTALALLPQMRAAPAGPTELAVVASMVTDADPLAGAVLRLGIDGHIAAHRGNDASYWEPRDERARARLGDLLGPLPAGCEACQDYPAPRRDPNVLLPATPLRGPDDLTLAAEWLLHPQARVGMTVSHARLLSLALATLAENALLHSESDQSPTACAALDPLARSLEIAVVDAGPALGEGEQAEQVLRELIGSSRRVGGGLASLMAIAERRGIEASLLLASGPGRVRIRQQASYATRVHFPGFAGAFSIHL